MNANDFITKNYDHLKRSAKNISKKDPLSDDLLHYVICEFLEKPNLKEIVDSGGATYYIVRMMMNSWNSRLSKFHLDYKCQYGMKKQELSYDLEYETESQPNTELLLKISKEAVDELDWYSKKLFNVFIDEGHTVSSLSRETSIPRSSIQLTIKKVRDHVKKRITEKTQES